MKNGNLKPGDTTPTRALVDGALPPHVLAAASSETCSRHVVILPTASVYWTPWVWQPQSHSRKNTHTFYPPARG